MQNASLKHDDTSMVRPWRRSFCAGPAFILQSKAGSLRAFILRSKMGTLPAFILRSKMATLVAAELEAGEGQFFTDFVEAGHAEVLALEQVVAGPAHQFADRGEPQPDHALAGAD